MEPQPDLYRDYLPNLIHKGETFELLLDVERLGEQQRRVHALMTDGKFRTLREIANEIGDPEASISARLRSYRSNEYLSRFYTMETRRRPGLEKRGVFEYSVRRREQ